MRLEDGRGGVSSLSGLLSMSSPVDDSNERPVSEGLDDTQVAGSLLPSQRHRGYCPLDHRSAVRGTLCAHFFILTVVP